MFFKKPPKFKKMWFLFNSNFLNGLKAPGESIIKTIEILEEKKLGKKKNEIGLKATWLPKNFYTRLIQLRTVISAICIGFYV